MAATDHRLLKEWAKILTPFMLLLGGGGFAVHQVGTANTVVNGEVRTIDLDYVRKEQEKVQKKLDRLQSINDKQWEKLSEQRGLLNALEVEVRVLKKTQAR